MEIYPFKLCVCVHVSVCVSVCLCPWVYKTHTHTHTCVHTHIHMPGECFTVTTLLTALLLEKKGIWCLLSKEKDGK